MYYAEVCMFSYPLWNEYTDNRGTNIGSELYVQCIICEAYVPYSIASPPPTQPPSPTPTSSPPPTQPPPQASSDAGAIAGGVIGGLIGVIIIVLIVIVIAYLIWKKKNSPSECDCSGIIVAIRSTSLVPRPSAAVCTVLRVWE